MIHAVPRDVIEALGRLDACSLSNGIESFGERLRNEGYADGTVRALFPKLPPMVGHAVTVRVRGANPPIGRATYPQLTEWWDSVLAIPAPRVVVIEDASSKLGAGALLGDVHVSILRALGCVGAVTDGAVRDLPAIESMGFPLFAGAVSVSHAYLHVVDAGIPVTVGGLVVKPGDLIHGDLHGVQTVPRSLAAGIPHAAAALRSRDEEVIALCGSADFTVERLRALLASRNP